LFLKLIALLGEPVDGMLKFGVIMGIAMPEIVDLPLSLVGEGLALAELHGKL
jgi:hypothetical protein